MTYRQFLNYVAFAVAHGMPAWTSCCCIRGVPALATLDWSMRRVWMLYWDNVDVVCACQPVEGDDSAEPLPQPIHGYTAVVHFERIAEYAFSDEMGLELLLDTDDSEA